MTAYFKLKGMPRVKLRFFLVSCFFSFFMSVSALVLYIIIYKEWTRTLNHTPKQVHICFGDKINDIMVTWSTEEDTRETSVIYREKKLKARINGTSKVFVDKGLAKRAQWIHRVLLSNLKFNTTYIYKAGSNQGWTKKFSFTTPPEGENNTVSVLLFGDLGVFKEKGYSIPFIIDEIKTKRYDFGVHLGDIAYNLESMNGQKGDRFMNEIEPFAANVPFMITPGNHEHESNFSYVKNRFSMPGKFENMFYSFNIGPVHFISFNTEAYYNHTTYPSHINKNKDEVLTIYNWVVNDLEEATKAENRQMRPWIIMYGHRPLYCSNNYKADQCLTHNFPHNVGIPKYGGLGLESLFNKYGIDMGIWAHVHSYERLWPVYKRHVYNGSYEHPYVNPKAPVHVISGSAGNHEHRDLFGKTIPGWSAIRSSDYSYTRLFVYNNTHLYMEQPLVARFSSKKSTHESVNKGTIVDSFWLIKDKHEPYGL